ncbi:unnamed protein product, partial [Allacma fusca]
KATILTIKHPQQKKRIIKLILMAPSHKFNPVISMVTSHHEEESSGNNNNPTSKVKNPWPRSQYSGLAAASRWKPEDRANDDIL